MEIHALAIPVHAVAASFVVLLGPVNILRRRRDAAHRVIGRTFVVMMYLVCVSGMFIYSLSGGLTLFHALAVFTFATTTLGVIAIRRRRIASHIGNMVGSWAGAVAAGAFAALVPGRYLPSLAISDPAALWGTAAAVAVAATAWIVVVLVLLGRGRRAPSASPR